MISLTVNLRVRPGHLEPFLTAIEQSARRTFHDELGCSCFDVVQGIDDDHHFPLSEVHLDDAALAAHRSAPHFADWRKAANEHVLPGSQVNVVGNRVRHGSGASA